MLQKHIFALLNGWTTHVREWRNHSCLWTPEYVSFSLLYVHISICSKISEQVKISFALFSKMFPFVQVNTHMLENLYINIQ